MNLDIYATSGYHLETLKCTETYGILNFGRFGCLNYTEFLSFGKAQIVLER